MKGRDEAKIAAWKKEVSDLLDEAEARDDRQRGDLGRLPGGGRHRHQRVHRPGDDAVLRDPAEEQARALPGPRGRPHGQPGLPRVLLRARRHHRGTPDEREPAGVVLPGAAAGDVLRGQPVQLGRGRLDVGHQPCHQAGDDRLPRAVLPAGQRDARPGGRPRPRRRDAAGRQVLRAAEVEGPVAPGAHRGALPRVLPQDQRGELQAALRREARDRARRRPHPTSP